MKRKFRSSRRASLQMVHFLLWRSTELRDEYNLGLDVACGDFDNSYLFRVRKYLGIDITPPRKALPKFPEAANFARVNIVVEDIPPADLVLCQETIGINTSFAERHAVDVVKKLVNSTNSGGTLIFNTGPRITSDQSMEVMSIILSEFDSVRVVHYGRWSSVRDPLSSFILAIVMLLVPRLRTPTNSAKSTIYFLSSRKLKNK